MHQKASSFRSRRALTGTSTSATLTSTAAEPANTALTTPAKITGVYVFQMQAKEEHGVTSATHVAPPSSPPATAALPTSWDAYHIQLITSFVALGSLGLFCRFPQLHPRFFHFCSLRV